jgi:hypothetical protein
MRGGIESRDDPGQLDWPSARLLIERLWVRAPPPEYLLPQRLYAVVEH